MNAVQQSVAVRSVIISKGKVLILRETSTYEGGTNHGKYDFPGGKIKPGETIDEALRRETKEECGLQIVPGKLIAVEEWRPKVPEGQLQIFGLFYICTLRPHFEVVLGRDHDDHKWIEPRDFEEYPLTDATRTTLKSLLKPIGK